MSKQILELREKRGKIIADARAILDKADAEKRKLTAEETKQYDAMLADQAALKEDIERRELLEATEHEMASSNRDARPETIPPVTQSGEMTSENDGRHNDARQNALTVRTHWSRNLPRAFPQPERVELRNQRRSTPEYCAATRAYLRAGIGLYGPEERSALSAGIDSEGGFTYPSEQFVNTLIKFSDDLTFIRGMATVVQVSNADSLGAPSLDTDPADSEWTSEVVIPSPDTTIAFGKRELHPHPLAKEIDVTTTLLARSLLGIESFVAQRMAYKFGITLEKHFLTGSGANQPLGVFTASATGISTARDVSAGNATTAFTYDGLVAAKMSLKGAYQAGAVWMFHRDGIKMLMQIKDGEGRPMWQPSMLQGQPDTLLGNPVLMSEYVPNTYTTGLYAGILGDFSAYWIAEAMTFRIQRLNELLARTRQVGFIGVQEIDGMPVLEEAFARVKLA